MKFTLSGQLKGPECKPVITQAVALRKVFEPWFDPIESEDISELAVILRVDGTLGSFGPECVENIILEGGIIECDVVIADHDWAKLSDKDMTSILLPRILEAIETCFKEFGISYNKDTLMALEK